MDYYEFAKKILIEIGAIVCCDAHDTFFYNTYPPLDNEKIYAIATEKAKQSVDDPSEINMKQFHAAIKNVLDDAWIDNDCPFCDKAYNE